MDLKLVTKSICILKGLFTDLYIGGPRKRLQLRNMGYFNITIQSTVAVNGIKLPLKENCVPELETITSTPDPDPGPPPPSKMSEQKLLKL